MIVSIDRGIKPVASNEIDFPVTEAPISTSSSMFTTGPVAKFSRRGSLDPVGGGGGGES